MKKIIKAAGIALIMILTSCAAQKALNKRVDNLVEQHGVDAFMGPPKDGETQVVGYKNIQYSDNTSGSTCLPSNMVWSVRNAYHLNRSFRPSTAAKTLLDVAVNDKELPEVTIDNLDEFDVRSVVETGTSYGGSNYDLTSKNDKKRTCSYYAYTYHHFQGLIVRVKAASATPATPAPSVAPAVPAAPATPTAPADSSLKDSTEITKYSKWK